MITIGMSSWVGKEEIKKFLLPTLHNGDKICDMGPGWGVYRDLLGHQFEWTGVEIWPETVKALTNNYNHVYECNIKDFNYPEDYDLVIFGDVLEHLSVEDAQECVRKAKLHSKAIMIAIPYNTPQEPLYGNEAEKHIQTNLTPELFDELYPGFMLVYSHKNYAYYYWNKEVGDYKNDFSNLDFN